MFGLVELRQSRGMEDPKLISLEAYQTYDEALRRADTLLNRFLEDYGEDYYENATETRPMAVATNGNVTWRAYIKEFAI